MTSRYHEIKGEVIQSIEDTTSNLFGEYPHFFGRNMGSDFKYETADFDNLAKNLETKFGITIDMAEFKDEVSAPWEVVAFVLELVLAQER